MVTSQVLTITWKGASGEDYKYWIYPIGKDFDQVPGNYIFAKEGNPNQWYPIYIGETGDLSERFDNHHRITCIKRNGATHIHAHKSSGVAADRRLEESDLIAKWRTSCND